METAGPGVAPCRGGP
uniref:Uncharacterized protein n=1 Tax=Anguilla anguilla TaxID=7936 RepID=A0A0E9U326_ANGAN